MPPIRESSLKGCGPDFSAEGPAALSLASGGQLVHSRESCGDPVRADRAQRAGQGERRSPPLAAGEHRYPAGEAGAQAGPLAFAGGEEGQTRTAPSPPANWSMGTAADASWPPPVKLRRLAAPCPVAPGRSMARLVPPALASTLALTPDGPVGARRRIALLAEITASKVAMAHSPLVASFFAVDATWPSWADPRYRWPRYVTEPLQ